MKKLIFLHGIGLACCVGLAGCDDYVRTAVVPDIYVNKTIVNGFVGDAIQLIASPTDGTYQYAWTTEDESVATVGPDGKVKLVGEGFTNIVVRTGGISRKVEVYSVVRIPLQDVVLSETDVELTPGTVKPIYVQRMPDNANDIPEAVWRSDNANVATVNQKGEISGVGEGTAGIRYTAGTIVKNIPVRVSFTRPFNGPHVLKNGDPTTVLAADFDFGGLGYAFNDNSPNNGNKNYRRDKGDPNSNRAGIEGNGNNLGWLATGDWFQYTVEVQDAGKYGFTVSLSAGGNGGKFHIEVDGLPVANAVDVPNNGSWSSWKTHPATPIELDLAEGQRKIKFVMDGAGFNLRALHFSKL